MTTIRLMIADDHHVFREGLRALIAGVADMEVVGEARTTEDAIRIAQEIRPDVVLMDLQMPGEGGIAATAVIVERLASTRVLILTMFSDSAFLRRAVRAGARGYLLKDAEPDDMLNAIRSVAGGQVFLGGAAADTGLALIGAATVDSRFPTLTPREIDVLDRMSRGLANDAIASRLGVSLKTVQNHVSSVLAKLGARDRAHAVAIARDKPSPDRFGPGATPDR